MSRALLTKIPKPITLARIPFRTMATSPRTTYHAVILGSGQSGSPLATALASSDKPTLLVEPAYIGGTCINYGCTPTKTMVASARVAHLVRRAGAYGVNASAAGSEIQVDMKAVRKRKRDIVESFRGGSERRLEGVEGLDVWKGRAKFVDERALEVVMQDGETRRVSAELVFVNVGCRPGKLDLPGAEGLDLLDSTSIMELGEVPRHLLVIGGGYIGVEFAQMFKRFGAEVTIVQRGKQLLGREDPDIADAVKDILTEDGLKIMLNTTPASISKSKEGVDLQVQQGDGSKTTISASHVLVALGRVPNTDHLDAAAGGIETDKRGFIHCNGQLETSAAGVYALGDIKGGPAFTHISYDDFRVIRNNVLQRRSTTTSIDDRPVPYTVFMDPQLGSVGMTETEARKVSQSTGQKLQLAKMPMAYVARALEMDESRGMIKAVVDKETKKILGATVLGVEGGELMTTLQVAMMGGVTYDELQDAVITHPLLAESINNLWGSLKDIE